MRHEVLTSESFCQKNPQNSKRSSEERPTTMKHFFFHFNFNSFLGGGVGGVSEENCGPKKNML